MYGNKIGESPAKLVEWSMKIVNTDDIDDKNGEIQIVVENKTTAISECLWQTLII